ncbi:MAG: SpoIIE family protein phosphatase [Bacteroidetes bacterium]|nr:SpoIIE family protein phosphatase [Bacteroidota bacterium]
MRYTFFGFVFLLCISASAQDRLDSLFNAFSTASSVSQKNEIRTELGYEYYDLGEYDSALSYFSEALKFIPNSAKEEKADVVVCIARTYNQLEDLQSSVRYYQLGNRLYSQVKTAPEKRADLFKDLGRTYYEQAQYDSAMVYYMQAKDIYETNNIVNHDYGVLFHYIGSVFKRQDKMDKACEYYQMQIDFGLEHNFPEIVAEGTYLQVSCYDNDTLRLHQDLKALQMYRDLQDDRMIALMYNNVAVAYHELNMLDSAYYFQDLNVQFEREHGTKSHLSLGLSNMASLLIEMKKYKEAEALLTEAETLAHQTESKKFIQLERVYGGLSELHYARGNYKAAYDYMELKYVYEDSAMDQEHQDAIHEMELAYETEKKEAEIAKLELSNKQEQYEKKMAEAEAARQSVNKKIYLVGGLAVLILLVFSLYKWRESNKQKTIIYAQKHEVEVQKELIEEKNKDITDSMIYASSIQQAIITSEDYIAGMFTDFFVFYKPRDIVSGDFYWAYQTAEGQKLIAVGDCTGHGVPGAMMSMLGTAFLNEIVIEGKVREPGIILDRLRLQIKNAMSRKGGKDGMDMAFCCIDGNNLKFAGANLPIYIVRNNELIEVKGDKQPVGFQPSPESPFLTQELEISTEDKIYLFSDGYADQFGGPKGKKYKYKTFKDKLAVIAGRTFREQRMLIDSEFETWKGDLEQLDDVCVIGVRV